MSAPRRTQRSVPCHDAALWPIHCLTIPPPLCCNGWARLFVFVGVVESGSGLRGALYLCSFEACVSWHMCVVIPPVPPRWRESTSYQYPDGIQCEGESGLQAIGVGLCTPAFHITQWNVFLEYTAFTYSPQHQRSAAWCALPQHSIQTRAQASSSTTP